ncbi:glycosyltransferase [Candidatus Planktophila versatilis]|uniref:Glycosyltransferase n=1 Tax=Candidatus Planktophila versatilis TaxID=1884905 RepID=A0AAC9YUH9_9ACTN|nr:hypothetical protein [Candidatus Planktophila versatilis]ASY22052.1 glycosyltransferase [Candidatus Planktophila versatilis]
MTKTGRPPIAVFGFIRHEELSNCLSSLENNEGASEFPVYIFIDGPRTESDLEPLKKSCAVASGVWGFKSVEVKFNNRNLGLSNSIRAGLDSIFKLHDSVIVIEDDLVLHSKFLDFMVIGLEKYSSEKLVASVQGFSLINQTSDQSYFIQGADCWGWATWRDRWESICWDSDALITQIKKSGKTKAFNFENTYNFMRLLELNSRKEIDSWAILWQASMFLQGKMSLYPPFNLVLNEGFGNGATHSELVPQNLPMLSTRNSWTYPTKVMMDAGNYEKVVNAYSGFIPKRHLLRRIKRWFQRIIG